MKKIALAALTGVILIGCTVERTVIQEPATTPAPDTTTVETTAAPTQPPTTPAPAGGDEASFIYTVNTYAPITLGLPDSELLSSGWATCDGFASGLTLGDVAIAISDSSGGDPEIEDMLSWIAVSAVMYLCPQYEYIMESDY